MITQILLMESLMCAQIKLTPVRTLCSWKNNPIHAPLLAPRLTRRVLVSPTWVMGSSKPFNSVAASIQPVEDSGTVRFDNTLPSKRTS